MPLIKDFYKTAMKIEYDEILAAPGDVSVLSVGVNRQFRTSYILRTGVKNPLSRPASM